MKPYNFMGSVLLFILPGLFILSCSESEIPTSPNRSFYPQAPPSVPYEQANAYDSVGVLHNAWVEAGYENTVPSDSTNLDTLWAHVNQSLVSSITAFRSSYATPPSQSADSLVNEGRWTYLNNQNRDWADWLAKIQSENTTDREEYYIHRIGNVLGMETTYQVTLDSINQIEDAIISENWPAGDTTEVIARCSISLAKHSVYYWHWVFTESNPFPKRLRTLGPEGWKAVVAADVGALVHKGVEELFTSKTYNIGEYTGAAIGASAVAAAVTWWDEIEGFLKDLWDFLF